MKLVLDRFILSLHLERVHGRVGAILMDTRVFLADIFRMMAVLGEGITLIHFLFQVLMSKTSCLNS